MTMQVHLRDAEIRGEQRGIAIGEQRGITIGEQRGRLLEREAMAMDMLKAGTPDELILRYIKITEDKLNELKTRAAGAEA